MEERKIDTDIQAQNFIAVLKDLPLHVELERTQDGVFGQVEEFPDEFEQAENEDALFRGLAHGLKSWGEALAGEFDRWQKGRENLVPYLLKIIVSSEQELLSCLQKNR